MLACILMSMDPAKHNQEAIFLKNVWIANVFVDLGSAKHEEIDVRLICRATHLL